MMRILLGKTSSIVAAHFAPVVSCKAADWISARDTCLPLAPTDPNEPFKYSSAGRWSALVMRGSGFCALQVESASGAAEGSGPRAAVD